MNKKLKPIISLPIHGNKPLCPGLLKGMMKISGILEEDI